MTDSLDQTIPEDKQEVPTAEQNVQEEAPKELTTEELEWSKLKGSSQERFRSILQERNQLRSLAEQKGTQSDVPPPPVPEYSRKSDNQITEEQQDAINKLRTKYGIVTNEDVEDKISQEREVLMGSLKRMQEDMVLENEYSRLETTYDGDDGRPVFDKTEIEDHMGKSGIYNPEKAYKDLYEDELFEWKTENAGKKTRRKSDDGRAYSEKPTAQTASKSEPLTANSLRERLAKPDGREWWDKNRERLLPQIGDLTS